MSTSTCRVCSYEVLDGEAVTLSPDTKVLHHLDATATRVFLACPGLATSDVVHRVAQEFDVASGAVEQDVRDTLSLFLDTEVVRFVARSPSERGRMLHRRRRRPLHLPRLFTNCSRATS